MKILCMAAENKMIKDRLESSTPQVIEHIIKICLYPENESVNHWSREVWAAIHVVQKQKRTKKFPSSKFIFEATWGTDGDMLDQFIQLVLAEYGDPKSVVKVNIEHICIEYFKWLSKNLSENGFVTNQDVDNQLNSLLEGGTQHEN